ncbi:MAG: cytochrome b/b6 domain-containing protein [Acidobacteriota bacterium]
MEKRIERLACFAVLVWLFHAGPLAGQTPSADSPCAGCHDIAEKLSKSGHAAVGCQQCHARHEEYPHPAGVPKPACVTCHAQQVGEHALSIHGKQLKAGNAAAPGCDTCHGTAHELSRARTAEFRQSVPDTCGACHSEVNEHFQASVHGKAIAAGRLDAPVCTDCHGEHGILPKSDAASGVNASHIRDTCARCHGNLTLSRRFGLPADRITSFDASFHGLAAKAGKQSVANCASCHGFHDILPSSDPKSMTNPKQLAATCGQCHPGAGSRFAIGRIHATEDQQEAAPVRYARLFYFILIPATIGFMLLHQGGDWIRKFAHLRLSPPSPNPGAASPTPAASPAPAAAQPPDLHAERMLFPERLQHAALVLSFTVLVWTGFALKYPDSWWAQPLMHLEAKWSVRGLVHRCAGAAMLALSVVHVLTLIASRRLRNHWLELIPRARDGRELLQGTLYRIGLRRRRPYQSPHSYIEKMEYWAVAWGTSLMGITGLLLWFNNWSLKFLPKWWLDLATTLHFYEAVLATLAIVVWHLYSVILDPDVYPMDTAWLTGKSVRPEAPHTTQNETHDEANS